MAPVEGTALCRMVGCAVCIEEDACMAECVSSPAPGQSGPFPWVLLTRPAHVGTKSPHTLLT